jgi:hypothetical protein
MTTATTTLPLASTSAAAPTGVTGGPLTILRLEGAAVLALAAAAYGHSGAGWGLFAACFLVPDLAFLGYLAGPRVGAAAYNATHSYVGAALLGALGVGLGAPLASSLALVWAAHVGFDRMLGYGLKYASAFGHTHLGRIGKGA